MQKAAKSLPHLLPMECAQEDLLVELDDSICSRILSFPITGKGGYQSLAKSIQTNLKNGRLKLTLRIWESIFRHSFTKGTGGYQNLFRQLIGAFIRQNPLLIREEALTEYIDFLNGLKHRKSNFDSRFVRKAQNHVEGRISQTSKNTTFAALPDDDLLSSLVKLLIR